MDDLKLAHDSYFVKVTATECLIWSLVCCFLIYARLPNWYGDKGTPFRRRHFQVHFPDENVWIAIIISFKFVPNGSVIQGFQVFFDCDVNKLLRQQSSHWLFETPCRSFALESMLGWTDELSCQGKYMPNLLGLADCRQQFVSQCTHLSNPL